MRIFAVGIENPRESQRFRIPLYDARETVWPWRALFESRELADTVATRMNQWDELNRELTATKRRLAAYTTAPDNEASA